MDPTALYYTLSTIALALAGAPAVLVAFVLFKLADLDRAIQPAQYELQGRQQENWPKLWDILRVSGLTGLEETMGSL